MTETDFKNILREAAGSEFAEAVQRRPDFDRAFSDGFERRMDRLVRSESRSAWRLFKAAPRRLAFAALVVIFVLSSIAWTVPEVRETLSGFYMQVFAGHAELDPLETTRARIENRYEFDPVPKGFICTSLSENEHRIESQYTDSNNNQLRLYQSCGRALITSIDNEMGEFSEITLGEKTIMIYNSARNKVAYWIEDGYYFEVTYSPSAYSDTVIDIDTFITWIGSVKPTK